MSTHEASSASTTNGLPVSPSLAPLLDQLQIPTRTVLFDSRAVVICAMAIVLSAIAALVAQLLKHLIWLITNIAFYGHFSIHPATPWAHHLGVFVIAIPIIGAVIVGFMARFGSPAIRGHGIPEAMEQVLTNRSRIPARMTWLKPVSSAIAIGTGGPFGAEGPIIATGAAIGSLIGQLVRTTPAERKTLLAVGAAAGMAATFGSPVSAVLLAIELLLFEFRPRSLVPLGLGSATAAGIRMAFEGTAPIFAMPIIVQPTGEALALYILAGALLGVVAVGVTRVVYGIEDAFDHLPIHWMWWPPIGAAAVGVVGYFAPRTLGVGYENISDIISGRLEITRFGFAGAIVVKSVAFLCVMKFVSWSISLGSGTSGGTLAPLFTIGGAVGFILGAAMQHLIPTAGVDPKVAALVGMAAIFAGASRALLASVVFAFETTLQPLGLLPLLGGCTAAYLVSCLLMRQTIMTEKIARRGVRVPSEYAPDFLESVAVHQVASKNPITLAASQTVQAVHDWIASGSTGSAHQGYPVVDESGRLCGVLTRRDLQRQDCDPATPIGQLIRRPPIVVYSDCSLREALDHMLNHDVGRLPVLHREHTGKIVGVITRGDLLSAHRLRLAELKSEPALQLKTLLRRKALLNPGDGSSRKPA